MAGSVITLDERVEYILSFPKACTPAVARRIDFLGGELLQADTAVLGFGNFVGRAELAGAVMDVMSTKIRPEGVSRLLQDVSTIASNLIFGWQSPTAFSAAIDTTAHASVPYHQLQFLRQMMLRRPPGARLQDWLAAIERSPTRRFAPERPVVRPDQVRRLDPAALRSIFARLDRLVPVPADSAISASPLATALTFGHPARIHFPAHLSAPRGRLSFDTPENRFVKHVVQEFLALIYRFIDHPNIHGDLRNDCRAMQSILETTASASFLFEAGRLTDFPAPSQALTKADGYRETFTFWNDFIRHIALPRSAAETARLLEGRDMATLYEYWVFLKILAILTEETGAKVSVTPDLQSNEQGESLALGLTAGLTPDIVIRFNTTFSRKGKTAYSTPLRPDVIVEINGKSHAFDAKYRLDHIIVNDEDTYDGLATYKRADLYKMHTYRDAIKSVQTAVAVYPGTEFVFFARSGQMYSAPGDIDMLDGVGAIPLRPADADPSAVLRQYLQMLINSWVLSREPPASP